jgi:hypothetical protein
MPARASKPGGEERVKEIAPARASGHRELEPRHRRRRHRRQRREYRPGSARREGRPTATSSPTAWRAPTCPASTRSATSPARPGSRTRRATRASICVEHIAGRKPHPFEPAPSPAAPIPRPQVASVGLTEAKAKEQGLEVKVGRFPFIGNGKAIALGETEGFVKTVFDGKTGELLGAHMIGAEVTEMIQGFAWP